MNFVEFKNKSSSEKITLAWVEPSRRKVAGWSLHSGPIYKGTVDHFVVEVHQTTVPLVSKASIAELVEGSFYFNPMTKELYIWSVDGVSPASIWTEVTYRLFFADAPIDLPWDLDAGITVPYLPYLRTGNRGASQFDPQQTGVALEGSGSVSFDNANGYWKGIIDKYTFQTKAVEIFVTGRQLPANEARKLYSALIVSQSYGPESVSFRLKDHIYKFRAPVELPLFTADDGDIPDSLIGKPKRRIYGRVAGLKVEPLQQSNGQYKAQTSLGADVTFDTALDSTKITASSTDIHQEICAGDSVTINETSYKVKSLSQVLFALDGEKDATFTYLTSTRFQVTFTGINTTDVSAGMYACIYRLSDGTSTLRANILGLCKVFGVTSTHITFERDTSMTNFGTVACKLSAGEVLVVKATNNSQFLVSQAAKVTKTGLVGYVKPQVPYRRMNRQFFLAHHALNEVNAQVTRVKRGNTFILDTVDDIAVGDYVLFDDTKLNRVATLNPLTKTITTDNLVVPLPAVGESVKRIPVQRFGFGTIDFVPLRDFEVTNASNGSTATLSLLAERDATPTEGLEANVQWKQGSKLVYGAGGIFEDIKVRDWLKPSADGDWYEVNEVVNDSVLVLSEPYAGSTGTKATDLRAPEYVDDDSTLFIDTYGMTFDGTPGGQLVKTAPDTVKHLIQEIGITDIDEESFEAANDIVPYLVSFCIPQEPRSKTMSVREAISLINSSVLGLTHYDSNFKIRYDVASPERSIDETIMVDEVDVLNTEIDSDSTRIYRTVNVQFQRKDVDNIGKEQETFSLVQSVSEFVENSLIEPQTLTLNCFLYNEAEAENVCGTLRFLNELPRSTLSIVSKLQLAEANLAQVVLFKSPTLYMRLGASTEDQYRLGIIMSIDKGAEGVKIEVSDLGNIYNRSCVQTSDSAPDFDVTTDLDKMFCGFITDEDGLVENNDDTFNSNLFS